ncbi:helix-turn-helix domain-containing protein [Lysinibacillus sp. FSL R7-0073]|uniref:helix-turn-helix domain-containing protein n=1 Tax=Lysinibacillus TaxID=400634 RepID=UPI002E1E72ED|nr:helix-turn-helix domain-containing protein [Lysinibacillus fusiformis]
MYTLKDVMSVQEAAERWSISIDTIHSRIRTITKDNTKFEGAVEAGLIKKSCRTWILTTPLMKMWFGAEKDMNNIE